MDEVQKLCDKIGILKNGKIIFLGTTEQATISSGKDNFEDAYEWYIKEEK